MVATERDSALGEMKTFREKAEQVKTEVEELQEENNRLKTELSSADREVMELCKQKERICSRCDCAISYFRLMQQMLTERDNLVREIEVLRKEKHETTAKLDHAVIEAMESRKQKMLMMAEQDRASQPQATNDQGHSWSRSYQNEIKQLERL